MIASTEAVGAIAVLAGGGFFLYRFLTGWMSVNTDVAIESSRVHINENEDYLGVIVKLARGEYGPLKLGDGQVRVHYVDCAGAPSGPINLFGTRRLASPSGKLDWNVELDKPPLSLHAKEKSEFATALRVPRKAACVIEVAFATHRRLDQLVHLDFRQRFWGQRRSSSISLPLSDA